MAVPIIFIDIIADKLYLFQSLWQPLQAWLSFIDATWLNGNPSSYSKWYPVLFQGELTPSVPPIQCLCLSATCGSLILLILPHSSSQKRVSPSLRRTELLRSFLVTMMSSDTENSGESWICHLSWDLGIFSGDFYFFCHTKLISANFNMDLEVKSSSN